MLTFNNAQFKNENLDFLQNVAHLRLWILWQYCGLEMTDLILLMKTKGVLETKRFFTKTTKAHNCLNNLDVIFPVQLCIQSLELGPQGWSGWYLP